MTITKKAWGEAEPLLIRLTGNELGKFPDTHDGRRALRAKLRQHLEAMRGEAVACAILGEGAKVAIEKRGIKETLAWTAYPQKIKVLYALREIIKTASAVDRQENYRLEAKRGVNAYFHLHNRVVIGAEEVQVEVVVEQGRSGLLYYDLLISKNKSGDGCHRR